MPTYNYRCCECDFEFSTVHSINEVIEDCPQEDCSGKVEKIFKSAPYISFKGSNFTKRI